MSKERMEFRVSTDTFEFFQKRKAETGESLSEILDKIVIQHQMQSEEFMKKQNDLLLEELKPLLVQLRTIVNETNVVTRTNKEILNYMLLADNYIKEFDTNGENKDHLVTINATEKIKEQVRYQRLIALENKRLNSQKR
ncbi:MAG: hypothetical protein ACLRLE_02435 [Turicibacter sp.]|uniref:hypothetical protein n=1 Tax=Turicibacter sp. GALT-G1 TaxID=2951140 RepID=UPI0021D4C704|nr:hypothetical protein [Turicibacter sp. GALT-G1]MCU7207692.1 hypothetical protein [Turicibacter sp. GALT-G1]